MDLYIYPRDKSLNAPITEDGGDWQDQFVDVPDLRVDSFGRQLDGVAAWMRGQDHNLASAQDALSVQKLIEKMLQG